MKTDREAPQTVAPGGQSKPRGAATNLGWLWGVAAVVVVVAAGLTPLLFNTAYFWRGDTQIAYYGAYYHLGEELRQGHYPLMEPFAWRGGNHIVEGNFGLLSPLVMVIGIVATFADDAIFYFTLVKLVFLGVAAAGAYLLTRSYGGARPMAFVVGVLVPLSGFTLYLDSPTWFPGLVVSGLLAVTWWAMRGCLLRGRNPFPTLLAGSLLACMGYVFGTAMLAVVVVACMVDALRARGLGAAGKGLLLGILMGIPALVVRLPFALSASVTSKLEGGFQSTGMGDTTISDLLLGMLPNNGEEAPLFYVSWLLPFLVFIDWRKFRTKWGDLVGLFLVWGVAMVWAFAPSHMGPLRYPMRLMPYVVLCTVLLGAIAFTRSRYPQLSFKRLVLALLITAVSGYITASAALPYWRAQLAVTLVVAIGLTVLWLLLRPRSISLRWLPRSAGVAAAFVGLWTILVIGVQHHYRPEPFAVDRGMPGAISKYQAQLPGTVGDTFMVGHVDRIVEPGTKPKPLVLIANSWYISGLRMANVHANTGHSAFSQRYCFDYLGFTCKDVLRTLMSQEPHTGLSRADLLSVNSIVLLKSDIGPKVARNPPPGWHIADKERMSVIWTRDEPVPTAGGVVWTSDGLEVEEVTRDDESIRLKVGEVPPDGGEIVLSRIDWPGYQVTNADVVDPVDDYLLTLRVSPDQANSEIDVRYAPPHWNFLLAGLGAAAAIGLVWSVGAAVLPVVRRRRRR